jgi:hypothetical protein
MFDLFGPSWSDLTAEDVEAFLREADKEGITWEAKADHERSPLKPESIRKAACGLANQIGGYLILGARESAEGGWFRPARPAPDNAATPAPHAQLRFRAEHAAPGGELASSVRNAQPLRPTPSTR